MPSKTPSLLALPTYPAYLRQKQVAQYLNVSVTTIWRWSKELNFPKPLNVGHGKKKIYPLYLREDIDAWAKQSMTSAQVQEESKAAATL